MNYKKFFTGMFFMTLFIVVLFVFVGCSGDDCGINCDGGPACGLACNQHGGCVGNIFCDGCTVIGCIACDNCGSCIGCGVYNGDLNLYAEKDTYLTIDTVFIRGDVDGINYSEAVFIDIVNDSTGKAKIKRVNGGFELTTSAEGQVTVEGKLGEYSDTVTITFIDADKMLGDYKIEITGESGSYIGIPINIDLEDNSSYVDINQSQVAYIIESDSTGSAKIEPRSEYDNYTGETYTSGWKLTATAAGEVTVKAEYTVNGNKYESSRTFKFSNPTLSLSSQKTICIGDYAVLSYGIEPSSQYPGESNYIYYEVIEGNATVSGSEEGWSIIATTPGTVKLKMTYKYGGATIEQTETLTFTDRGFQIAADGEEIYVGYDIPLVATSDDISGFDATTVTYKVVEGDATVEGNVLRATAPGAVKVTASYVHNGAVLSSNELVLDVTYDENTIQTVEDLQKLNGSDKMFNLISDLDLSEITNWTPITGFTGTLLGNGHKITGLSIRAINLEKNKGLFDVMSGTVENLVLEGTITANGEVTCVGLLCGHNTGTIKKVSVSGTISASYSSYVGGIVGFSQSSDITECKSAVSVNGKEYVGGIAGGVVGTRSAEVIAQDNTNTGSIIGTDSVGGVFGAFTLVSSDNSDDILISNNKNEGSITASGDNVGGIIGYVKGESNGYIKITECTNTKEIIGIERVGGIIGYAEAYVAEISACSNTASISGSYYVGSFAGKAVDTAMIGLVNDCSIAGKAFVGGIAGQCGALENCTNKGTLTLIGYYIDENNDTFSYVGGIAGIATSAENCINNQRIDARSGGKYVGGIVGSLQATRSADATFKSNVNNGEILGTSYVGGIFGEFYVQVGENSDMIIVSSNTNNMAVTGTGNCVGGIVGSIRGEAHSSYISNVTVTDCTNEADISGIDYVGGIVGDAPNNVSDISFSFNTGNVVGHLYVGGFAGRAVDTSMRNLKNNHSVTGKAYLGGIAGYAGKLEECENNGTITSNGYLTDESSAAVSYVGGIAGFATDAKKCTNNSIINISSGGSYVGGIVGYLNAVFTDDEASFSLNKNHGDITGKNHVGGIFGAFAISNAGGNTLTVKSNSNDGSVVGNDFIGGVVGYANGIDAYVKLTENNNDSGVKGKNNVGGIVGYAERVSEISACTNVGDIEGSLYVGGFAGYAPEATMRALTNNSSITGKAFVGGIAGYAGKLDGCTNNGDITNMGYHLDENDLPVSMIGGIAGYATSATGCTNNAIIDISTGANYVGGIVGYLDAICTQDDSAFSNNKNYGDVTGKINVGGIFGAFEVNSLTESLIVTIKANSNNAPVSGINNASSANIGGIAGTVKGDEQGKIKVLVKLAENTNSGDISGLTSCNYVGGIVGYAELVSEIISCTNMGDVEGACYVGGFAGYAKDTAMRSLTNSNAISGKAYVGGISGYCGSVDSCINEGIITITENYTDISSEDADPISYVGGIAGYANSAVSCTNSASIDATAGGKYAGGIVGYLEATSTANAIATENENTGNVSGTSYIGGIFGYITGAGASGSEIIVIEDNTNRGSISATGNNVGGIVGAAKGSETVTLKIINCYDHGTVVGADYVGGIAGNCEDGVVTDVDVWGTNFVIENAASSNAAGTNVGTYYGAIPAPVEP